MSLVSPQIHLAHMEAAAGKTRRHLSLIQKQIDSRAERLTVTEKVQARSQKRSRTGWTHADKMAFLHHADRLSFERCGEIELLTRELHRQERAIADFHRMHGRPDRAAA